MQDRERRQQMRERVPLLVIEANRVRVCADLYSILPPQGRHSGACNTSKPLARSELEVQT